MAKNNTIKLTESELKKIISESVKKVLKESIKAADTMNAVSRETAQECGFEEEYVGIDGGFELWKGPLPESPKERKALLNRLGIDRFTSENYVNNTCRITVDPSGKIAAVNRKSFQNRPSEFALMIQKGSINPEKAIKYLVSKGYDPEKAEKYVKMHRRDYVIKINNELAMMRNNGRTHNEMRKFLENSKLTWEERRELWDRFLKF